MYSDQDEIKTSGARSNPVVPRDEDASYDTEEFRKEASAALGSPWKRLAIPAAVFVCIIVGVVLVVISNKTPIGKPGGQDSTLAALTPAPKGAEPAAVPPAKIAPETVAPIDTAAIQAETAVVGAADTSVGDDFYKMLNTDVSDQDAAISDSLFGAQLGGLDTGQVSDSMFENMLYTPLAGLQELPPSLRGLSWDTTAAGGMQRQPYSIMDTTRYNARFDSLQRELDTLKKYLVKTPAESLAAVRGARKALGAMDSTRLGELKKLAKIVESMEPSAAAAMLNDKSSDEAALILFRVKPRVAAKVLEKMPAAKRSELATKVMREK